ncbi:SDR family NAD(P)-dependent oxidoreductase [Actinotignum sanguinis]|nr:SDR family NAD(P)-dependent oxidoreductase [Actinotignum sanguinis]MDV2436876.1 SDR family NAD(P)-dependent oxidoreductase [Actinotignum sanguinis]
MSELKDKVVLITGADGNLGSGIAHVFAQAGASVIVHSLRESTRANELAKELRDIGVSAFQVVGDICSEADVDEMIEAAFQQCGNVDVLVNNAGVQPVISLEEMTVGQWKQVVNVNLNGTFIVSKKMASRMVHANVAGSIINIASVEASIPAMNHAHYDASKAGVKMMTRNFALEFGKYGIRVTRFHLASSIVTVGWLKVGRQVTKVGWRGFRSEEQQIHKTLAVRASSSHRSRPALLVGMTLLSTVACPQ